MSNKTFSLIFILGVVQADRDNPLPGVEKIIKKELYQVKGRQETRVSQETDLSSCSTQELVQFMMWASDDRVRNSFANMPLQAKLVLLKEMNIQQYGFFLHAFSDDQWRRMWQKLPQQEQRIIPQTKLEQLKMIRDVWCACSSGDIGHYASAKGDEKARDLSLWRDKALKTIGQYFNVQRPYAVGVEKKEKIFYQWLDNTFKTKKMELLKEFSTARE